MKKIIQIPGAPAPIGPYSQAILVKGTLYVSGQIPVNPFNGEVILDDVEKATRQIMENITTLLKEAGMNLDNIVKTSIFMRDLSQFAEMNATYASFFNEFPPARETVQVARLPLDVPVEISCIAVQF